MKLDLALSIGEVARRTGLTERALRLYESEGLVSPMRSEGGRRFYATGDLNRLQQVQVLRRAGYSLAKISAMLRAKSLDAAAAIDMHLEALRGERDSLVRAIEVRGHTRADR